MLYRIDDYTESETNPVTGRVYDDSWIVYCLTDSSDYQMMVGNRHACVYTVKVSRHYNIRQEDLEKAQQAYRGHTYNEPFLRENEPDVLIHSTTYENWESIQKDGCLKSGNALHQEKGTWEDKPIGQELG